MFRFRPFAFTEAVALLQSFFVLRYACAPTAAHAVTTVRPFSFSFRPFFLVSLKMSLFPNLFISLPFSLCMESTSYVFFFRVVCFYLVTTGWIFDISLCESSMNQ